MKEIYKPPTSMLDIIEHMPVKNRSLVRFTLAAYLFAPLATSIFGIVMAILVDAGNRYSADGILSFSIEGVGEIFLFLLGFLYICLLIVGLPIHWVLGKISQRNIILYLLVGAITPAPIVFWLESHGEELFGFSILGIAGAICFGVFWFVAVHIPKTTLPNKANSSETSGMKQKILIGVGLALVLLALMLVRGITQYRTITFSQELIGFWKNPYYWNWWVIYEDKAIVYGGIPEEKVCNKTEYNLIDKNTIITSSTDGEDDQMTEETVRITLEGEKLLLVGLSTNSVAEHIRVPKEEICFGIDKYMRGAPFPIDGVEFY